VNNVVKVKAKMETTSELVVEEVQHDGRFNVYSRIYGPVRVFITNLHDNNSHIAFLDGTVEQIISNELYKGLKLHNYGFKVEEKIVSFDTRGTCCFNYGIKQRVRITSRPLLPTTKFDKVDDASRRRRVSNPFF
jgi:hypothetical protein